MYIHFSALTQRPRPKFGSQDRGFFLSLSFFLVPSSRAQVPPVDRFWRSIRHMTPSCPRMCLLGVSLIRPHLGGQIAPPPKKKIGGMNRRVLAELVKSKKCKTTGSTPTKFYTVIKTTKCPSYGPKTLITNSRWWTAAVMEKSPYFSNGLIDRREIWHSDAY